MVMVSKHEDLLGEKEVLVSKIFRGAQKAKFLWFVLQDNGKQNIGRVGNRYRLSSRGSEAPLLHGSLLFFKFTSLFNY